MGPETINGAMLVAIIGAVCYLIVLRKSPRALKHLAAWAAARASALEKCEKIERKERRRWEARLGLLQPMAPATRPRITFGNWLARRRHLESIFAPSAIPPAPVEPIRTRIAGGGG